MTDVREFTRDGIEAFRSYLHRLSRQPKAPPPWDLLDSSELTVLFDESLSIDQGVDWVTKRDAGRYLHRQFTSADVSRARIDRNQGLWTWLSLFYFDLVCPASTDGTRSPNRDEHYVFTPEFRNDYRHRLAMSYVLYRDLDEAGNVLLCSPIEVHGDMMEQFGSRQEIVSNVNLMRAITRLYYDPDRDVVRRGATVRKRAGTARRFIAVKQQLDLTYDLYGMTADEVLGLLPGEFERWKTA